MTRLLGGIATMAIVAGMAMAGCTRATPPNAPSSSDESHAVPPSEFRAAPEDAQLINRMLFPFDYQAATELALTRADPVTGDHWSIRLTRELPAAKGTQRQFTEQSDAVWEVKSASLESSDGDHLIDRRANDGFIMHLLDTLRTFRFTEVAPNGPIASFGLAPPRFALKWKAGEQQFELLLGAPVSGEDNGVYAIAPGISTAVYVARGAAIAMLTNVTSFDYMRHQTLATFASDDVDELEIRRSGRTVFYAQREGERWTNRAHHTLHSDVSAILDGLTHLRIEEFIDDSLKAGQLEREKLSDPMETIFTDIHGTKSVMKVGWHSDTGGRKLIATLSTRPNSVFVLYPGAIHVFEKAL